jgi:hypothetical protein
MKSTHHKLPSLTFVLGTLRSACNVDSNAMPLSDRTKVSVAFCFASYFTMLSPVVLAEDPDAFSSLEEDSGNA